MALGDGTHKLPVKAGVRKAIGKDAGDQVTRQADPAAELSRTKASGSPRPPNLLRPTYLRSGWPCSSACPWAWSSASGSA